MAPNPIWKQNRYLAPRARLMFAGACLGGMADLAISGALPLRFAGTDGGANLVGWCAVLGVWLGLMSGWPKRHRRRASRDADWSAAAAVGLGVAELHRYEHHHDDHEPDPDDPDLDDDDCDD
jgi:hypothetical protein